MVDYDYYINTYLGSFIPPDDFSPFGRSSVRVSANRQQCGRAFR